MKKVCGADEFLKSFSKKTTAKSEKPHESASVIGKKIRIIDKNVEKWLELQQ